MNQGTEPTHKEIGFGWWKTWAWLGLTLGNMFILRELSGIPVVAFAFIAVNSVLCALMLRFNKYAFLIATIVSVNPILWIINGIYLKNRWHHPKTNASSTGI